MAKIGQYCKNPFIIFFGFYFTYRWDLDQTDTMPGIVVSLSEALAVSGTPLAESYVWAILNQSAVYFNKITKGRQKDLCNFVHVLQKKNDKDYIYCTSQNARFWKKKWTICLVEENKAVARDIFVVTPESLCFHSDGGVEISESPSQTKDSRYLPPDLQHAPIKTLQAAEKVSLS